MRWTVEQKEIDRLQHEYTLRHAVGRCLHIGCGMKKIAGAVNLDPNPERRPWSDVAGDGFRLPFLDGVFDSVVSSHVLPLFADINAVLREMARVLVVGGKMAHVVPDLRYAPDRFCSHWRFEKQATGWKGPEAFRASLGGLDDVLSIVVIESFESFNWSFKVVMEKI